MMIKYLKFECIQIDQQDFQLFINDRVFINIHIHYLFDKRSFISTLFNKLSKSHETFIDKRKRNQLIVSK